MHPRTGVSTPTTSDFAMWEVAKDVVDEFIDLSLNARQSGHPGGSRSKVHAVLSLVLSGTMRWDVRRPWLPLQDRVVLSAGHTVPVVYAVLAMCNEALAIHHERTGDERDVFPDDGAWALRASDLLALRRNGGLPGHAEMAGKSLFLKFNTGPSGHGMAPAAGAALALRMSGHPDVKVFCVEGEGGLTAGAAHETKNTAWGLGLANLAFLLDWNDYGIDARPASAVVAGTPHDWFAPYGWHVLGTPHGMEWAPMSRLLLAVGEEQDAPTVAWFRTVKGRGYGKVDAASHGSPWPRNSKEFWAAREHFMGRYGMRYSGFGADAPAGADGIRRQAREHVDAVVDVMRSVPGFAEYIAERLHEIAAAVPEVSTDEPAPGDGVLDAAAYPPGLRRPPGTVVSNRAALSDWGSYVNTVGMRRTGRPLFVACAADLAESTGIAGFGKGFDGAPGAGWYERDANPGGAVLPQEITEFANAGVMTGLASVNLAVEPRDRFAGFWGACSTYGAFSYLKYGPLRLFSQLAQDSEIQVGRVLYVAGHSGYETADDSRTHFGIYEPDIMTHFPAGHVVNLHPWEYNEVPVVLAAALSGGWPIVVLHLTRPAIEVPDRERLGIEPAAAAGRGAYLVRRPRDGRGAGTVIVRGTRTTANVVAVLDELDRSGPDLKIVAAISWELFDRQDQSYRDSVLDARDRADAMVISNGSLAAMRDWHDNPRPARFSLVPDWDGRWRTGGSVDEVEIEARLSPDHIRAGLHAYANRNIRHLEAGSVATC